MLGFDLAGGSANGVAPVVETALSLQRGVDRVVADRRMAAPVLTPFVGGRLALLLMNRSFEENAFPAQFYAALSPGLVAGAAYHFSRSTSVVARARLHYLFYDVDGDRSLGYWELATMVAYDF